MKHKRDKNFIKAIPEAWRDMPTGTVLNHPEYVKCVYVGPVTLLGEPSGRAWVTIETKGGGTGYRTLAYSDLTPVEQWEPEVGEVVAVGGYKQVLITTYVGGGRYNDIDSDTTGPNHFPIYRIPEDFKLTRETLAVKWWIANGEKYEVGHE